MRPNILYIHSHDTGRCVQPYGYAVPTPAYQRLGEQGIVFRNAHCAGPTCSPSRAALLTGQSPHSAGMLGLAHRGFALRDPRQHLAHVLRGAGYQTVLAGVQHEGRDAGELGYQRVLAKPTAAAEFLHAKPGGPFFLAVGFFETHREFPPPGPLDDPRWVRPAATMGDCAATRADGAGFHTSLRRLDEQVGQVLAALDGAGLAENTLVICTTDHGIAFPGMKCHLTVQGTGVLLIVRGPGGFNGGQVSDALVSQVDIWPTLCDVLDLAPPTWLQGQSLMPVVRGTVEQVNREIFSEVTYHAAYEPMRSIRTPRHNYIRRFGGRLTPVLPNCDDSPSKDAWLASGGRERELPTEELYDCLVDPNETSNLVTAGRHREVTADLQARLTRWMQATDDPLLRGDVPPPQGARVNDPDGLSPKETPRIAG